MSVTAPRTVLVLGGGGVLGAYQAGALLALAEAGVVPDAVYGCSVGALNGAFLAVDPGIERARQLVEWWRDRRTHGVLSPPLLSRVLGVAAAVTARAHGMFDARPLRRLITTNVTAHDIAELAVPVSVTTTCLECGGAVQHDQGPIADLLVASCALPGLFPPVRLPDGHLHVDGGVVCGVPVAEAVRDAGPADEVLVLDCALAPVTSRAGGCAALPIDNAAEQEACGLRTLGGRGAYQAPVESHRGALQVVLTSFTIARAQANIAAIGSSLDDPRVQVLPHVADAWAAGLLPELPTGPRDCAAVPALLDAGRAAAAEWVSGRQVRLSAG